MSKNSECIYINKEMVYSMRKILNTLIILVTLFILQSIVFADFADVKDDAVYKSAVYNMKALGIMKGTAENIFSPDEFMTREQFAKVIVSLYGFDEEAVRLKGSTVFPDVESTRWSAGYINVAVNKGIIKGMIDGNFHPEEKLTFAQCLTVMLKALGYNDSDVSGLWPYNYIEKAKKLDFTNDLIFDKSDSIPRWTVAVLSDRLLKTDINKANPNDASVEFYKKYDLYGEYVITGNSATNDNLAENQVQTDKGIYYTDEISTPLSVGATYRLKIKDDKITNVFDMLANTKNILVKSYVNGYVSYEDNGVINRFLLPDKTLYYYNGTIIPLSSIGSVFKLNSVIVLSPNDDNSGYKYGVVIDPLYSKHEVAKYVNIYTYKIGNISLGNKDIIKNGQAINKTEIKDNDVVYNVSDILGREQYILVLDNRINGEITDILPNSLSAQKIKIGNTVYDISKDFDVSKLISIGTVFKINDTITALLGYNGKIIEVMNRVYGFSDQGEYKILGNSTTIDTLLPNQVKTDKGIFNTLANLSQLELGNIYELSIDNNTIVDVGKKERVVLNTSVDTFVGNEITCKNGSVTVRIALPENASYYYKGNLQTFDFAKSLIKLDTSIIFVSNDLGSAYEYVVIADPLYSAPQIVSNYNSATNQIGTINLESLNILKDNNLISKNGIVDNDVVYKVTDIWGNKPYINVIDNRVYGLVKDVSPSILSPNKITIGTTSYDVSSYMNLDKIKNIHISTSNDSSIDDENNKIAAVLGYDNKVVDILQAGYYKGPFSEYVILGDNTTLESLVENQISTDKGVYYLKDTNTKFDIGEKYKLVVDGNTVIEVGQKFTTCDKVTVKNSIDGRIYYTKNGSALNMTMPANITYYYNGSLSSYAAIKSLLKLNTSVKFAYNALKTGYDYAVVTDPVYSEPNVAINFSPTINPQLGNLKLDAGYTYIEDGKISNIYCINNRNVVYKVTDIWGGNVYYEIIDNIKKNVMLDDVLPNKLAPTQIKLSNNQVYELSEYLNLNKINNSDGAFTSGELVNLVLDKDGKVIDICDIYS